jgi:hypothetical protein
LSLVSTLSLKPVPFTSWWRNQVWNFSSARRSSSLSSY